MRGEADVRFLVVIKQCDVAAVFCREYSMTLFWDPIFSPGIIYSSSELADAYACMAVWAAKSWLRLASTTCGVGLPRAHSTFCTSNPVKGWSWPKQWGCYELFTGALLKQHFAKSLPLFRSVLEAAGCERDSIVLKMLLLSGFQSPVFLLFEWGWGWDVSELEFYLYSVVMEIWGKDIN